MAELETMDLVALAELALTAAQRGTPEVTEPSGLHPMAPVVVLAD
jgi:hypothetical protein